MQNVPDILIGVGFLVFLIGTVWVIVARLGRRSWKTPVIVTGVSLTVMLIIGIFPIIVIGFLLFLIGTVWVIVARLGRRGWKTPTIVTGLSLAVMNIGGLLALSDVFGHSHSIDPGFSLYPSTVQENIAFSLMLLGFLAILVGIAWVIPALFRSTGRKTPAVVMGLGFAVMVQGGILQLETYEIPHDHQTSGRFEKEYVETAMLVMMVDKEVASVMPSTISTNSWSNNPTGRGTSPLYPDYLLESSTTYFYCWTSQGVITHQDESPANCLPEAPVRRVLRQ